MLVYNVHYCTYYNEFSLPIVHGDSSDVSIKFHVKSIELSHFDACFAVCFSVLPQYVLFSLLMKLSRGSLNLYPSLSKFRVNNNMDPSGNAEMEIIPLFCTRALHEGSFQKKDEVFYAPTV